MLSSNAIVTLKPGTSLTFAATSHAGNVGQAGPDGRTARQGRDNKGYLTYGAYIDLPPGRYQIKIFYSATGEGHRWDVAHQAGQGTLAAGPLDPTGGTPAETVILVDLVRPTRAFEVRSHFSGEGELTVQDCSVTFLAAAPKAAVGPATRKLDPAVIPPEEDTFPAEELRRTDQRRWILDYCKPGGIGAEFGVFRGHFAEVIAHVLQPRTLYLVDLWTLQGERYDWSDPWDLAYLNNGKLTTRQALADTRRRLTRFAKDIDLHFHEQACEDFCVDYGRAGKPPLDFIYLDTSHSFEDTLQQLHASATILASNGVLLGDDWVPDRSHPHHGVFQAVHRFIKEMPFELVAAGPLSQFCLRRAV